MRLVDVRLCDVATRMEYRRLYHVDDAMIVLVRAQVNVAGVWRDPFDLLRWVAA